MIWWHERVLRHTLRRNTMISIPMWDRAAKGVLVTCSCGKTWAK